MAKLLVETNPVDSGAVYYVIFFNANGQAWNPTTPAFETYTTTRDNFDVPMSEIGVTGVYEVTFPSLVSGVYSWSAYRQAGGSPSHANDTREMIGSGAWDGSRIYENTAAVDLSTVTSDLDNLVGAVASVAEGVADANSGITALPTATAASVRTNLATELARIDVATSSRLATASYTAPDNSSITAIGSLVVGIDNRLPSDPADASVITAAFSDLQDLIGGMGGAGGGVLNARIAYASLTAEKYLEIIQGEEKVLTFIVEADGRFDVASASAISVKIKDPEGNVVEKSDSDITRITEELDVQVFRVTLTPDDTNALDGGLARFEIAFDTQKAILTHVVKVVESL